MSSLYDSFDGFLINYKPWESFQIKQVARPEASPGEKEVIIILELNTI